MSTCTVEPCDAEVAAKGMCKSHYNRAYYAERRDAMRARSRAWYDANPDKARAIAARRDKQAMRDSARRWYWANRIRAVVRQANRRAKQAGAVGVLTVEGVTARFAYFGNRCWICKGPGADSPDHVISIGVGGPNFNSNIRPAHKGCNFGRSWEGRR
jgi:hypothetical protein